MSGLLGVQAYDSDEDENEEAEAEPGKAGAKEEQTKSSPPEEQTKSSPPQASPGPQSPDVELPRASPAGSPLGNGYAKSPPVDAEDDSSDSGVLGEWAATDGEDPLPPSPKGDPDPELSKKLRRFLQAKAKGQTTADCIGDTRDYSNPYVLGKAIEISGIDEYGSGYPAHLFSPDLAARHPSDYFDAPACERPAPKRSAKDLAKEEKRAQRKAEKEAKGEGTKEKRASTGGDKGDLKRTRSTLSTMSSPEP